MNTLWLACIAVQCVVSYRIVSSPKLRTRYLLLAAWLMYMSAASVLRFHVGHDARLSADYARIWTVTAWPLIAMSVLAALECVLAVNRQYGNGNRTFTRRFTAIAGAVFLALSGLEAWMVEIPALWSMEHQLVNVATLFTRVVSATLGALLLAQWALMRLKPLPISRNLHCVRIALAAYFLLDAAVHYATEIGWDNVDNARLLTTLGVIALTGSIGCWSWVLWRVREAHEWDVAAEPFTAGERGELRSALAVEGFATRARRYAVARVRQALRRGRPLRTL